MNKSRILYSIAIIFSLVAIGTAWTYTTPPDSIIDTSGFRFGNVSITSTSIYSDNMNTNESYSYLIYTDGTTVYAKNGSTGKVTSSGTDFRTIFNTTVYGTPTQKIVIAPGNYVISTTGLIIPDTFITVEAYSVNFDCSGVAKCLTFAARTDETEVYRRSWFGGVFSGDNTIGSIGLSLEDTSHAFIKGTRWLYFKTGIRFYNINYYSENNNLEHNSVGYADVAYLFDNGTSSSCSFDATSLTDSTFYMNASGQIGVAILNGSCPGRMTMDIGGWSISDNVTAFFLDGKVAGGQIRVWTEFNSPTGLNNTMLRIGEKSAWIRPDALLIYPLRNYTTSQIIVNPYDVQYQNIRYTDDTGSNAAGYMIPNSAGDARYEGVNLLYNENAENLLSIGRGTSTVMIGIDNVTGGFSFWDYKYGRYANANFRNITLTKMTGSMVIINGSTNFGNSATAPTAFGAGDTYFNSTSSKPCYANASGVSNWNTYADIAGC